MAQAMPQVQQDELKELTQVLSQTPVEHLYHMTHEDNLETILSHGLLAHGNQHQKQDISNREVNARRSANDPHYHRPIHEYVPFYFNPRNAMLYRTEGRSGAGNNEVVILGYHPVLLMLAMVTDRNASASNCKFSKNFRYLLTLNWGRVFARSWYDDYELKQAMMAEALVHQRAPTECLQQIICRDLWTANRIRQEENIPAHVQVVVKPNLFFRS